MTECFFITQRALHVGLLPAVNTHTHVASELHKQTQAKIPGRNEEMLKQLSAVSWLVERERGERERGRTRGGGGGMEERERGGGGGIEREREVLLN